MRQHTRYDEIFSEGRLAGEIGVRREHNPYTGTDLADVWEEGRTHGEQNFHLFQQEAETHFSSATGPLVIIALTVIFIFALSVAVMAGY